VTVTERLQRPAPSLPARAPAHLRLTRRGRVVLTLAAAATASLAWLAAASGAQAAGHGVSPGAAPQHVSQIVVQPGQTLWSIATQADPQADPRLVIQRIIAVNKLAGGSIVAGQRLVVPHV
jgi:LysM repeat protein